MNHWIDLNTPHGPARAWRAEPAGPSRGAVLVLQEIFGVNAHMRAVADRYAAEGYVALAPSFFDPVERGVELDYDQDGFARGRALVAELGFERAVAIVDAAARLLQGEGLRVAVVGFCWGGTVALLANTRLGLPAISYYGARNVQFLDEPLRAPMQFHFGERDASIPAEDIARHREAWPQAGVYVYPAAGHAFNRDVDIHAFEPASARLAHERMLAFLDTALA